MPRRTWSRWVSVVLAPLVLLLVACADTGSTSKAEDTRPDAAFRPGPVGGEEPVGEPAQGGQLRIADYYEPATLDPLRLVATGSSGGNPLIAIYGTLTRFDHESGAFVPYMAEALTPSDDFTTWRLSLREGVSFTDGTAYDAAAVKASIDRFTELGGFTAELLQEEIKQIRVAGPREVVFELNRPWGTFDSLLATEVGMIPAPASYAQEQFKPIGAGPFGFDAYAPSESLTLVANANYWEGAPHLDSVRFEWHPDDTTKMETLDAGQVDLAFVRDIKVVGDRMDDYRGYTTMLNGANTLMVNQREGRPGQDPRVLQAIGHAIDRDILYSRVFGSDEFAGGGLFVESSRWFNGTEAPEYDPARAKQLIEEAKKDGFDGKITYLGGTGTLAETQYVTVKGMLEQVGLDVEGEFLASPAERYQRLQITNDFDLAWGSLGMPDEMVYLRLRSNVENGATGYVNPEMDELLDRLQAATDDESRSALTAEVEELWSQTLPMIRVGGAPVFTAWSDEVRGVQVTTEHMLMLQHAWLD